MCELQDYALGCFQLMILDVNYITKQISQVEALTLVLTLGFPILLLRPNLSWPLESS